MVTYVNALRKAKVGPSGIINKLTTIKHALNMVVRAIPKTNPSDEQRDAVHRVKVVKTNIDGMVAALRGEASAIKAQKDLLEDVDLDRGVFCFLRNKSLLLMATTLADSNLLSDQDAVLLRQFLTTFILHTNAQRPGLVVNMQIGEFRKPHRGNTLEKR